MDDGAVRRRRQPTGTLQPETALPEARHAKPPVGPASSGAALSDPILLEAQLDPERLVPSSVVSRQAAELRALVTAHEAARAPARNPVRWFFRLLREVINKADRDRLLGLAAEAAFFAVLTLFPALLVVATVLGQLGAIVGEDNAQRVEQAVLDFLDQLLTENAGGAIETVRELFNTGANALTFASALALISLSTAFATLINTVNIAYDVPETRGWWRRRWLGLLLGFGSVLTGAVAITLLVVGPLFGPAEEVVARIGLGTEYDFLWSYLRWPVAFGGLVLWATTMDHLMPDRRTRWRYDLPGGLLTALLWLAASWGLNLYLDLVVTASPLFGALGGGLILMTWFYLLCVALLAGAELNAILLARRRHRHSRARARAASGAPAGRRTGRRRRPEQPVLAELPQNEPVPASPPPDGPPPDGKQPEEQPEEQPEPAPLPALSRRRPA